MDERPLDLSGRVIVITGATNGIGRVAAVNLGLRGAHLVLLSRSTERGERVRAAIAAVTGDTSRARVVECDLASFDSVRRAIAEVRERYPAVHALANNAGLIASERMVTADGHEQTFQVNHLSHFLLTAGLLPQLERTGGRVVNVASDAHFGAWRGLRTSDPSFVRGHFSPFAAYAHSKLANIMFTYEFARRSGSSSRVTCNVLHPGVVSTGFGAQGWGIAGALWDVFVPKLTAEQGADTLEWCLSERSLERVSGSYFYKRAEKGSSMSSYDRDAARWLWEYSCDAVGAEPAFGVAAPGSP